MEDNQKQQFKEELDAIHQLYSKDKPTQATLRLWWNALVNYPVDIIIKCLDYHVKHSKFLPKPADIIEIITTRDGRPSVEEAWSLCQIAADEDETIVWSEEMQSAWLTAALPIVLSGDKVGARMAFKEHYVRLVQLARDNGLQVKWIVSPGRDAGRRSEAVKQAADKNLISFNIASKHLIEDMTADGVAVVKLLNGPKTDNDIVPEEHKERMEEMRKQLKDGSALAKAEKEQKKLDDKQALEDRRELLIKQSEE
jgi:hypothetical protein